MKIHIFAKAAAIESILNLRFCSHFFHFSSPILCFSRWIFSSILQKRVPLLPFSLRESRRNHRPVESATRLQKVIFWVSRNFFFNFEGEFSFHFGRYSSNGISCLPPYPVVRQILHVEHELLMKERRLETGNGLDMMESGIWETRYSDRAEPLYLHSSRQQQRSFCHAGSSVEMARRRNVDLVLLVDAVGLCRLSPQRCCYFPRLLLHSRVRFCPYRLSSI